MADGGVWRVKFVPDDIIGLGRAFRVGDVELAREILQFPYLVTVIQLQIRVPSCNFESPFCKHHKTAIEMSTGADDGISEYARTVTVT